MQKSCATSFIKDIGFELRWIQRIPRLNTGVDASVDRGDIDLEGIVARILQGFMVHEVSNVHGAEAVLLGTDARYRRHTSRKGLGVKREWPRMYTWLGGRWNGWLLSIVTSSEAMVALALRAL